MQAQMLFRDTIYAPLSGANFLILMSMCERGRTPVRQLNIAGQR
jgi:hypothetical protein